MPAKPPVTDWAKDFDHFDEQWIQNPYPIWDNLRQQCPVAHTERYQGVYFPSRYKDIKAVALDPEHFSSQRIFIREERLPLMPSPPISSDPPDHRAQRAILTILHPGGGSTARAGYPSHLSRPDCIARE